MQEALMAKQIVKGNQHDPQNTFQRNHIRENSACLDIYLVGDASGIFVLC